MDAELPVEIAREVEIRLGAAPAVSSPGGMSGASVLRLTGRGGAAILKRSNTPREWHVYTRLRATLVERGVALPELLAQSAGGSTWWLLMEDIASALPRERWLVDPAVMAMLRALHSVSPGDIELLPQRYEPAWPAALTDRAFSLFSPPAREALNASLERMRLDCQPLFEPVCLISGDPNPANWGVRAGGTPVLFDWERCTFGTPALDLAITVPGLGDITAFAAVSTAYAGHDRLAPDIAHAKVWSVVEFLAGYAAGEVNPGLDVAALAPRVPVWVDTLAEHSQ